MSFTTRCPTCGTMFRVVADQLKISEGWVRCGHCADVFDATLYLEAWGGAKPPAPASAAPLSTPAVAAPAPAPEPLPAASPLSAPGADTDLVAGLVAEMAERDADVATPPVHELAEARHEADRADGLMTEPDLASPRLVHEADSDTLPPPLDEPEAGAITTQAPELEPDFQAELRRFAGAQGRSAEADPSPAVPAPLAQPATLIAPSATEPQGAADAPQVGPHPADALPEPGFVRQARRRAFWQSTPVRLALHGLVLVLGALLVMQWVVHERDWLAARQPALKPWLVRLCEPLQCQVKPLRRIESVVIDSSELVRRLGNFHSFDFVLKNTADVALAMPALELTLTDASDTAIARRVFLPAEWPSAPGELAAGGTAAVSLRLVIAADGTTPMTGYRALVFYP
jgi:predicted Zn finger-like uncharacterized protein